MPHPAGATWRNAWRGKLEETDPPGFGASAETKKDGGGLLRRRQAAASTGLVSRGGNFRGILFLVRPEDFRPLLAGNLEDALEALLQPRQRMVDQDELARHLDLEVGDGGAPPAGR